MGLVVSKYLLSKRTDVDILYANIINHRIYYIADVIEFIPGSREDEH